MKTQPLSKLADIQTGPFGSQLHKEDYVEIGTPIVTVEHLGNRVFTEQNLPRVKDADKERLTKYVLCTGDIVFSRVGSVDRCSYVDERHNGWMFSGRCLRVRPTEEIDAKYLYYFFCLEETKKFIRNIAVGATMPSINTKLLGEVEITYPDITGQRKIASLLSAIDDKIELNNAINDNLQQQALAIVENALNVGEPISLAQIMSFENGFAFQSSTYQQAGKYRVITIKNVQDGYIDCTGAAFLTEIPCKMKPSCLLKPGDALLSLTGNVGRVGIVYEDNLLLNQRVAKICSKKPEWLPFLYFWFRMPSTKISLETIAKGTAQQNLSPVETLKMDILFDEARVNDCAGLLSTIYAQILNNSQENLRLAAMRDALLPKLMSGEIDVSDVKV